MILDEQSKVLIEFFRTEKDRDAQKQAEALGAIKQAFDDMYRALEFSKMVVTRYE